MSEDSHSKDSRSEGPTAGGPLIEAVRGGDRRHAEELLAAGTPAGPTAPGAAVPLAVAAAAGDALMAELLLEHGADPDQGAPLALAAERGAFGVAQVLLASGADPLAPDAEGRTPAQLARRWQGIDPEQELRRRLATAGPGPVSVHREEQPDETVLIVAELDAGPAPRARAEVQDGHAAVLCLLEESLGVDTPFDELAARALAAPDSEHPAWWEPVRALHRRGGEEAYAAAERLCGDDRPRAREFGVDVLAQFDYLSRERPYAERIVALLRRMADQEQDPEVLQSVLAGLGHQRDPVALPELARHVGHPYAPVRHSVAVALVGLVPGDHAEAMAAVLALVADPDEGVRDWAAFALASVEADTPEIRETLAGLLADPSVPVVAEAARGLAHRGDPRAVEPLLRLLRESDPDEYAWDVALESAESSADPRLRAAARTAAAGTWAELRHHP
ncbi:HEAT repeat domain-containing protein [Kitasatospora sp. NPDC094015]|uniref:HEAT repeat domain-containing protein n=1 Tax=Kitasatospora sp. NPDC094015 TaxID=3155205 RepID=UPI0033207752